MKMSGADALLKALEQEGVEDIFGIPGGASMPIYDPLVDRSSIRHILCRHEQGAGHAAEGYAWATGKVGVCMATSRPRCHEPGHAARRREDGLGPDRRDHGPGADARGRQRRLPGGRHHRHHDAGHEAQLPGEGPRRDRRDRARGVPHRVDRAPRPGADRPPEGRAARRDDVQVARADRPPRLQAHDQGQHTPGGRGGEADHACEEAGALRGRRRDQGRRARGAVQARDHRATAGRHDADGARRVPRLARALPGHARHARQLHGGHRRCRRPTCSWLWARASTTA